ncbi:hypothetical protein Desku_1612 [Desulfofundulus kuznetsovii DSM 6115]|uniref:Uncharacterized protein n=1 Tax=Desulfofundulus kuznetsovii (strain DSM 6115 / VKM B-1805 / 17) TaxID=760568 RepID=A0AAU8PN16_DESK7|nr:hypothetical protein Desku_1612 [Desulfofundulus kuznetsovii DSM 6115]
MDANFGAYREVAEKTITELSSRIKHAYPELAVPVDALINAARLAELSGLLVFFQEKNDIPPDIAKAIDEFAGEVEPLMRDISSRLNLFLLGGTGNDRD